MINQTVVVGRMTNDAELRYTGSGIAIASFTVAVERSYSNANGERETDFIRIIAWRKTAEIISNFTTKGSLVGITGRIQTRNYTNNEGRKVYITEIVCENFQMLEPKSVTESRKENRVNNSDSNINYNQSNQQKDTKEDGPVDYPKFDDPFENNEDSIDISDDDLPF